MSHRLHGLCLRGIRLPFHSCNISGNFAKRLVCIIICQNIVNFQSQIILEYQPLVLFLVQDHGHHSFRGNCGVGTSVNSLQVIFFPVRGEKKLYVPCSLPVGLRPWIYIYGRRQQGPWSIVILRLLILLLPLYRSLGVWIWPLARMRISYKYTPWYVYRTRLLGLMLCAFT